MRILCMYSPCGPEYVRKGWGHVFDVMGHEFIFWSPEQKPTFDAFDEFNPDIFLGTTYDLDDAMCKCIIERPEMKVGLFGSASGPMIWDIDLRNFPVQMTSTDEMDRVCRLKEKTGKPDFVFIHYHDNWMEQTMSGWDKKGIKSVGLMNAADVIDYYGGSYDEEFDCDLGFVGGYWTYKARNLDKFILPLCNANKDGERLRVKIYGNQKWPVHQYAGFIDTKNVKNLFNSAKVCPNVSEPHSTVYGFDIIERPFKILVAGGFCVSDYVKSAVEDVFGESLPSAKTPEEFREMIFHYMDNPEEKEKIRQKGQDIVLKEHTYFHRVAKMLNEFGLEEESKKCMKCYEEFLASRSSVVVV